MAFCILAPTKDETVLRHREYIDYKVWPVYADQTVVVKWVLPLL